jgi:hypothetical protein
VTIPPPETPDVAARRRVPWWAWILGALVAITALIAAIGGFADVPEEKLPEVALGEQWIGGEANATVHSAYLSETMPVSGTPADDGEIYLVVDVTAAANGDRPSLFARSLIRVLVGDVVAAETDPDRVLEVRSGTGTDFLQPGLPVEVAYAWSVPITDLAVGDEVIVGIFDQFGITGDPLWGDTAFTRPTPVARVLTTIDRYVAAPVEEIP